MEMVSSFFRRHAELEPTGKLSLLGEASCSAERMSAYVRRRNPRAPDVAELYLRSGKRYGVRGDVAYCQAAYETRCWTKEDSGLTWSPLLISQWTEEAFVEELMQILFTFATEMPLPQGMLKAERQIAVIERSGWRGKASCWEDLNGKWSPPGLSRYGQDIVAMWRCMVEWRGQGEVRIK